MSYSRKQKSMGKQKNARKQIKGGVGGASGYGEYVWGSGNQQHGGAEDNVILPVNNPLEYKGGDNSKNVGGGLETIAVPAILIAANHLYKPMEKGYKKKPSFKGGKRGSKKGAGILTELAVPAVLLAANHFYKRTAKRVTNKRMRNKRVSFKRSNK